LDSFFSREPERRYAVDNGICRQRQGCRSSLVFTVRFDGILRWLRWSR
jgi:hypothetical protein